MRRLIGFFAAASVMGVLSCTDYRAVATVGSEKITFGELNEISRRKAKLLGVHVLSPEQKREVLESMIMREVVCLFARAKGYSVSDKALQDALEGLSFLDGFRYRDEIEKSLLFEQMKRKMVGRIHIPKKDIKEYYRKHKEEFIVPETFKVYLVKVVRESVNHVLKKVRENPEAFDDMAIKRVSRDLMELNRNAPYTPKEGFPEEMWSYLEHMKIGEIAGPVNVKRGVFLFKLVDKKPASVKPFTEAYFEIEHLLVSKKEDEAFKKRYKDIKGGFEITIRIEDFS